MVGDPSLSNPDKADPTSQVNHLVCVCPPCFLIHFIKGQQQGLVVGDPLSTQMLTLHDPGELAPHLFAAPPQFIHRLYGQIWDNRPCLTFDNHWCVYRTGVFAQRGRPSVRPARGKSACPGPPLPGFHFSLQQFPC